MGKKERLLTPEVRWLLRQVSPFASLLFANFICIVGSSALTLVDPLIMKWLIDVALPKRDVRLVLVGALACCMVYLASLGMSYTATLSGSFVTQKMKFRIRISLLRRIHILSAKYHSNAQAGETLYRLEQDVDRVAELTGDIFPVIMHMVIVGIMVVVTMGILNRQLTLIVLPLLPIFYLIQRRFAGRLKEAADAVQGQEGKINAFLQEHLAGILQLQLLNRISTQGRKFARLAAQGARFQVQQRMTEIIFGGASVSVIVLGMCLILGFGGYQVTRGALSIGGLVAFYAYVVRLFEPIGIAVDLQSRFQRVGASIRRILEIMDKSQLSSIGLSNTSLGPNIAPEVEFQSVWFSYKKDRLVLSDMSFRVEAGETVALVGLNGSGKSTVGMLTTRLHEPDTGRILIGGRDIQEVSRRSLRATVTLVPQNPILFDATVRENLLYGNPAATGQDLQRVVTITQLDEVLRKLPRGLDEPLGPLGARLSGGEKTRLALARTLLQQPRILIVDEITSALDAPTAENLLQGLELFRQARTLLVISHRPATILWAHRILVVDHGQVVDSGHHEKLMLRCDAYRAIWQSQDKMPKAASLANDEACKNVPTLGMV
jgi:ATP-binding cassette subfamily B protein